MGHKFAVLCFILQACGGGVAPAPSACSSTIQLEWDSTGHGTGATDPSATPTALVQAAFPNAVVTNTSLGGATSSDRITGNPILGQGTSFPPWPAGAYGKVYVSGFGINNAWYGLSLDQYRLDIRKIAAREGTVLVTPTPINLDLPHPSTAVDTAPYAQVVREEGAAAGRIVVDAYTYVINRPNWKSELVDSVHPGNQLYRNLYASVINPGIALACH